MDDAISRQAVLKLLSTIPPEEAMTKAMLIQSVKQMDAAQPERKKGHYIGEADGYADGELVYDIWSCSECGCYFEDWDEQPTYSFCPNCGADMRGETDE